MPNVNQIIIAIVVIVIVVVGIVLFTTGKITQTPEAPEEQEQQPAVTLELQSLAGQVQSVNVGDNSFVMIDQQSKMELKIRVGEDTDFIRLEFPFDPSSPPEGIDTFIPERIQATIQNLEAKDFVFVRSSHAVNDGEDVVNPLEIQILP